MTPRFIACDACGRHVKGGDVACPFCGVSAPVAGPLPRLAGVRMTRAAMIAAGTAGTMASLLDCGSSSSQPVPFYGVACSGSECVQGDQDSAPPLYDGGSGAVFYGVVCTGDACGPVGGEDAASAEDASDAGSDAADAQTGVSDAQADATDASDG